MNSFEIAEPRSVEEAIGLLHGDRSLVRPIGGGTALMLMMKAQLFKPTRLVSLRRLGAPFTGLSVDEPAGEVRIGAMTTFAELEQSPLVARHLAVVPCMMKALANIRVRNVATVGGNLAHADPHLDLPPVWTALDAEIVVIGPRGQRRFPVADLFAGYYETTLGPGELIAELRVPVKRTWRADYVKVTTRALHDWPALGLAVAADLDGRGIKDIRLVLSAAVDRPTRLHSAEEALRGMEIDDHALARAGDAAIAETKIESDDRGSAAYKKHLLRVHLARSIRSLAGIRGS